MLSAFSEGENENLVWRTSTTWCVEEEIQSVTSECQISVKISHSLTTDFPMIDGFSLLDM